MLLDFGNRLFYPIQVRRVPVAGTFRMNRNLGCIKQRRRRQYVVGGKAAPLWRIDVCALQ